MIPRWQPVTETPVTGARNVHYEVAGRSRTIGCGGLGLVQAVVDSVGLRQAIDSKVSVLKRHRPYHESDHVLALIFNLLAGGRCLDDHDRYRRNDAFLDAVGARRILARPRLAIFLGVLTLSQCGS